MFVACDEQAQDVFGVLFTKVIGSVPIAE